MMKLSSHFVGARSHLYQTRLEAGVLSNYSAAVGEYADDYFDDSRPAQGATADDSLQMSPVLAHPTFPVVITWPIISQFHRYFRNSSFPFHLLKQQVHFHERIEFYRPLYAGQTLTVESVISAILPHQAGTRLRVCHTAKDDSGGLLFVESIEGLLRDVICEDGGQQLSEYGSHISAKLSQNPIWQTYITIDRNFPYIYDACSGLSFPIHTSPFFAKSVGLPGIIVQGNAVFALAVKELCTLEGDLHPESIIEIACNFSRMVKPGSRLSLRLLRRVHVGESTSLLFEINDDLERRVLRDGLLSYRSKK